MDINPENYSHPVTNKREGVIDSDSLGPVKKSIQELFLPTIGEVLESSTRASHRNTCHRRVQDQTFQCPLDSAATMVDDTANLIVKSFN